MGRPLFSLNVATYNQLHILKMILEALKDQTEQDFEVIVCDDGSSDGTKEYMKQFPNIRYFWQEDLGFRLAKSKNNGIKAARGKYFVSLEADVIPHYKLLEEYKKKAEEDTILLGVRHDIAMLPKEVDYDMLDKYVIMKDFRSEALKAVEQSDKPWRMCSGCNVLFPTDRLKEIGGWNEDFKHYGVDDYEVCLRMYMSGCKIKACQEAYGYHLKHDLRMTVDENIKMLEELEAKYEDSTRV